MFGRVADLGSLTDALAILTSMITPALLISACGTLLVSTSNRLGRVVDRIRKLSEKLEELAIADEKVVLLEERRALVFTQLDILMRRAQVLQRGMTALYVSVCAFVATSVAIGLIGVTHAATNWTPVVLGLVGVGLLFWVSVNLIHEARLARTSLAMELEFFARLGKEHAPTLAQRGKRRGWRRRSHA